MTTALLIICFILVLCGLFFWIWHLNGRLATMGAEKGDAEQRAAAAEQRAAVAENSLDQQRQLYETRMADREQMYEARMAEVRQTLDDKFKAIANDTLEATVNRHTQQAGQSIETVIAPMREAFQKLTLEFERRSLDTRAERTVLQEGINALRQLNIQVSDETRRLTQALRGNTGFQGRWGEMVLENILEGSGLEASRWVVYQESTTTDGGERLRPDAVIHCPRERDIIIDSKVSLSAYLSMTESQDADERKAFCDEHVRSVEKHLKQLSNKDYQSNIGAGKAGFVLMFIPHEGAYLAAMQANNDLWQRAYDKHVVIVSPTHLVTVIRLVEQMWQTEDQTANSIAIADEATAMLNQLNLFLDDFVDMEKAIDKAREKAESAHKRMATGNGNLLRRAERLKNLGIKTKKDLILKSDESDNLLT